MKADIYNTQKHSPSDGLRSPKLQQIHHFMKAKFDINDEFYTSYHEIKQELNGYKTKFKNKIVFCNCNDGNWSNFYKYFKKNIQYLKFKKLITTKFNINDPNAKGIKYETDENGTIETPLQGNGDFRTPECIELMKEADIVVTNPPFSLFRELVALLIEHNKQFLIVGGTYSITYKKIFELYKQRKIWLGNHQVTIFDQPNGTQKRFSNISWFTNLKSEKDYKNIILTANYYNNKHLYPEYDNYYAIEVSRWRDIPADYDGVMGVPLTFFLRHNPAQFEILGCDFEIDSIEELKPLVKPAFRDKPQKSAILNGQELFTRVFIRRINPQRISRVINF